MEVIGKLSGGVAHEFNNLLTVMQGHLDAMAEDALPDGLRARVHAAGPIGAFVFVLCFIVGNLIHLPGMISVVVALLAYGRTEGTLLALAGATMWAGSNIVVKTLQRQGLRYDPLALIVWSSAVSGVTFVLIAALFDDPTVRWNWTAASWATVAWSTTCQWTWRAAWGRMW
jgi:hypothetical protein